MLDSGKDKGGIAGERIKEPKTQQNPKPTTLQSLLSRSNNSQVDHQSLRARCVGRTLLLGRVLCASFSAETRGPGVGGRPAGGALLRTPCKRGSEADGDSPVL